MATAQDNQRDVLLMFVTILAFFVAAAIFYFVITLGNVRKYNSRIEAEDNRLKEVKALGRKLKSAQEELAELYPTEAEAKDDRLLTFLEREARKQRVTIYKQDPEVVKHLGYVEKYIQLTFKEVSLEPLVKLLATVQRERSFLTVSSIELIADRKRQARWTANVKLSPIVLVD